MRKTAITVLMMMGLAIALPSCEQAASDSFPIMESFYTESQGLRSVTSDSVNRFCDKVNGYVSVNPKAKTTRSTGSLWTISRMPFFIYPLRYMMNGTAIQLLLFSPSGLSRAGTQLSGDVTSLGTISSCFTTS